MKNLIITIFISLLIQNSWAQSIDFAVAAKKEFAPSISYQKNYGIGTKKKLSIGWGIRANAYFSGEKS